MASAKRGLDLKVLVRYIKNMKIFAEIKKKIFKNLYFLNKVFNFLENNLFFIFTFYSKFYFF